MGGMLGFPEWILFLAIAGLLVFQLLIPPIVGLADNGDYPRVLGPVGLESTAEGYAERYGSYVNRRYRTVPRTGKYFMYSSELMLAETAVQFDRLITDDDELDLVVLGAVHLTCYLFGIYLILLATQTFSLPGRVVTGFAVLSVGTDVAYVAVLNSFYQEAAGLVFLTILIGISLVAIRAERPSRWHLSTFFVCAALFVGAKAQYYLLVLPLLVSPLFLLRRPDLKTSRSLVIALAVALLLFAGFLFAHLPSTLYAVNLWHTLFMNILVDSNSPERDLEEFGLDPDLTRFVGVGAFVPGVPLHEVTAQFGLSDVGRFYFQHPERFLEIGSRVAESTFVHRDPDYGNYTRAAGKPPRTLSRSVFGWSELEKRLFPRSLGFVGSFLAVFLFTSFWETSRAGLARRGNPAAVFCLVVAMMTISQFAIVAAFEGTVDVVKHLYMFQLLFDVCLIATVVWLLGGLGTLLRYRSQGIPSAAEPPPEGHPRGWARPPPSRVLRTLRACVNVGSPWHIVNPRSTLGSVGAVDNECVESDRRRPAS